MKFATLCFLLLSAFHAWAAPLPSATEDSEECEPPAAVIRSPESVIRVGYTPFGLMIDERLMLNSLKSTLTPENLATRSPFASTRHTTWPKLSGLEKLTSFFPSRPFTKP